MDIREKNGITFYLLRSRRKELQVPYVTLHKLLQYNTIQYKICKAPCCRGFRGMYIERKCADTTGTVPVPWAGHFHCRNIYMFFK